MGAYTIAVALILIGFAALVAGGELLVRGASALATVFHISPLVIGLTVVAFGTSAPELAVVIQSSLAGKTGLAIGNAVGSNIFNVLFVLGISALVAPLVVSSQLIRLDVPLMIGASVLLLLLGLDGSLGRADGVLLFGLLLVYVVWSVRKSRRAQRSEQEAFEKYGRVSARHLFLQVLLLLFVLQEETKRRFPKGNMELSTARALAVWECLAAALGKQDEERLSVVGFGPHRPRVPNDRERNRYRNRRVEIRVEEPG